MHMLTHISRSKGNQVMKNWSVNRVQHEKHFFFLKNHTQNAVKILFSDPFLKYQN